MKNRAGLAHSFLSVLSTLPMLVGALLAGGCNTSAAGSTGVLDFTPSDCGRIGCTFDSPIAVGSTFSLQISGDANIRSLEVRSDDPTILGVTPLPDVAGRPTWEISVIAVGDTSLEAIEVSESQSGEDEIVVIDRLSLSVTAVESLQLSHFLGAADGPSEAAGFDESWTVTAGQPVSFRVTPFDSEQTPMLGRFEYDVVLDEEISLGLIDLELGAGRLYTRIGAGSWNAQWTDQQGRSRSAQFVAQ